MTGNQFRTQTEHRPETPVQRPEIYRAKVVRVPTRYNTASPGSPLDVPVAIVKLWDGLNEGSKEIPVQTLGIKAVDDEIYIYRPYGGTSETNPESATVSTDPTTELPIVWRELGGGGSESVGEFQFMVHQVVAQNVGGWDLVRLSPPIVP